MPVAAMLFSPVVKGEWGHGEHIRQLA